MNDIIEQMRRLYGLWPSDNELIQIRLAVVRQIMDDTKEFRAWMEGREQDVFTRVCVGTTCMGKMRAEDRHKDGLRE